MSHDPGGLLQRIRHTVRLNTAAWSTKALRTHCWHSAGTDVALLASVSMERAKRPQAWLHGNGNRRQTRCRAGKVLLTA